MMPIVPINSLVRDVKELENIPIRVGANPSVYIRDVATVQDASDIPAGYAMVNGRRAVYILVTKRADASTLSVVRNVKEALPRMQAVLPDDIRVSFEFDQSSTVTNAVRSLATEGVLGAMLTGLMVLVFLRDWRSVIVVVLNIPFAICGAIVALWLTGQTINLMTLGGLALAIGILVDEATVEIENIHHKMEGTRSIASAVRQGNMDTAVPRLLAMLCILAVFLPSFFMQGAAQALFVPLSLAVGFAMVSSYLLSSTFVPVLSTWLLRKHHPASAIGRETLFERTIDAYGRALARVVRWRWVVVPAYLALAVVVIVGVGRVLGLEIFPKVDAGRFQLRMRAPTGTRIEETEKLALDVLETIRAEVGADDVEISLGYIGLIPSSYPINAIFQWTGGPEEVVLRVALKEETTVAVEGLKERLRTVLAEDDARGAVLVRAGRHRQRGHELRLADPRGVHGQRPQPRGEPGVRREGPGGAGPGRVAARPCNSSRLSTTRRWASRSTARRPGSAASRSPRWPVRWSRRHRRAGSSSRTTGPTPRPGSVTRCRSRSPTRS